MDPQANWQVECETPSMETLKTSIFIKTCRQDLPWLRYCVQSIEKYCSGFHSVLLVLDKGMQTPDYIPEDWEVDFWPVYENCKGYIQQQIAKMNAHLTCKDGTEAILFVDSDCVFHALCTPADWFRGGKPILMKTAYSERLGDAQCWKQITERLVRFPVEFEYMRRMPIIFLEKTVAETYRKLTGDIVAMISGKITECSEFNAMGACADLYHKSDYFWINTETQPDLIPAPVAKQFWSWGGITKEIKAEIEAMLA